MAQRISHAARITPSVTDRSYIVSLGFLGFLGFLGLLKVFAGYAYLFTLSEDLELQLDGSFRGSRVPLLGTELNDFVDGGPECQLLVVLLLST